MLKIGCDPEILLKKQGRNISGHGFIPGNKAKPHHIKDGAVQLDGFAAEFNIIPAKNIFQFYSRIESVLTQLETMLPTGVTFNTESSAYFDTQYMQTQPEHVRELGCNPDYNAYTGEENPPPNTLGVPPNLRTAAGHVHLGWTKKKREDDFSHFSDCIKLTRELDFFLGLPFLYLDVEGWRRRNLYGKAGCFRPKSYGVEYRVLSNFWLSSKELIHLVFVNSTRAYESVQKENPFYELYENLAQTIINENNTELAREFCEEMDIYHA